jgi:uncharacterized membrane protein
VNFKLPQSSSFMTLLTPSRFRQHVVSPTIGIRGRMHLDDRVRKPWFYILVAAFLFLIDDYLILSGLSKGSLIFGKISSDPVIYSSYGEVLGLPLGLFGLLTHLTLFWALIRQAKFVVLASAALIVISAVCFVMIQAYVLSQWCAWCNSAHVLGMVLAFGSTESLWWKPRA